jgi:murein L,D-transpeptidase YafK
MMTGKMKTSLVLGSATVLAIFIVSMLMAQSRNPTPGGKDNVSNEGTQERAVSEPQARLASDGMHIVIKKSARTLELFDGERLIHSYKTALGFTPIGDKEIEGDGKTPEGEFYVFVKNSQSKFYLSLGLSYPNAEDAKRGFANKLISRVQYDQIRKAISKKQIPPQNTKLGGDIYIHGGGSGQDWTWGCIALENPDIKELFDAAAVGMRVNILP